MDVLKIIQALQAAAQLSNSLVGLASEVQGVLSSENEAKVIEALKDLRTANDSLHARVQMKLRNA